MAATEIKDIIKQVRVNPLLEVKPKFWSDEELTDIFWLGVDNLWGAILDLHQDHFLKIDVTHVTLPANATQLTGVPEDCFRVQLIEPRDTTEDGTNRRLIFSPRKYKHPDFANARARAAIDPTGVDEIFFQLTGVGSPIAPPTILTAPMISSSMNIRLAYNPTLEHGEFNPVPGNSDNAMKAWIAAYALGKQREDQTPDAGWLGVYSTEKQSVLTRLTPRQEQEEEVVEDFFQGYGNY